MTSTVQITQHEQGKLNETKSNFRFRHSTPIADDGTQGVIVRCEIIDEVTERVWCKGVGDDEQDAFRDAIVNMDQTNRPKRVSELAIENADLKSRLAKFEREEHAESSPDRTVPPGVKPTETGELTRAELRAYLDHKGVDFDGRLGREALRDWAVAEGHLTAPEAGVAR